VAFAFDTKRKAILLVAGDKSGVGEKRFYQGTGPQGGCSLGRPLGFSGRGRSIHGTERGNQNRDSGSIRHRTMALRSQAPFERLDVPDVRRIEFRRSTGFTVSAIHNLRIPAM
jgi:hypothetical protein